jgi:predicted DCC family thiol-disulfide oxidoreductase YuxK
MMKNIILFDGICNLCNSSIQFIIKNDRKNQFMFASLQSKYGQKFLSENKLNTSNFDSIILCIDNQYYQKSDAALLIAKKLNFPINLIAVFYIIPKKVRDLAYTYIAKNRYKWFGKQESCWIPTKELQSKFLS